MFNALKGMIWEEDPNASKAKPAAAPVIPQHSTIGLGGSTSISQTSGVNPEYVAAIKKVTFGRNTALTSLMTAADKLTSIIPDPSTRLKSAYAMMSEGRTVSQITDAVDIHLADVSGEVLKFKNLIDGKLQTEVGGLEQQDANLSASITNAQAKIVDLQNQITELTSNISKMQADQGALKTDIATKRTDLDGAMTQFTAAAEAVKAELNANKAAIVSTLT